MSVLVNDSGSVRVGVKDITEIINPASIVQWYDAEDLTMSVGNTVAAWNDRSISADHLTQSASNNRGILQKNSLGFKYVLFDHTTYLQRMFTTLSTINTNETVIAVVNQIPCAGAPTYILRSGNPTTSNRLDLKIQSPWNITQSTNLGGTNNTLDAKSSGLKIISFSRRLSSNPVLRNSFGFNLSTISGLTGISLPNPSVQSIGWGGTGLAAGKMLELYSFITINQYVDDDTLRQLIRSVSIQKGVSI